MHWNSTDIGLRSTRFWCITLPVGSSTVYHLSVLSSTCPTVQVFEWWSSTAAVLPVGISCKVWLLSWCNFLIQPSVDKILQYTFTTVSIVTDPMFRQLDPLFGTIGPINWGRWPTPSLMFVMSIYWLMFAMSNGVWWERISMQLLWHFSFTDS